MIFNVGSINIDYVYRVPHLVAPGETLASHSLSKVLGGKGANQSVALSRSGAEVSHIGRLSSTDTWALQLMNELGVNTDFVETSDEPSGHAIIQVDDAGENSIVLFGGANQQLTRAQLSKALDAATANDWLLIQNECNGLSDVFALAAEKQCFLAFNPAPMNVDVLQLPLTQAHCLIVNEVEAAGVVGNAALSADDLVKALVQQFPNALVALTLGVDGVRLIDNGMVTSIAAPSVQAVDTTGAGDTFVGYFLSGLMAGISAVEAAHKACFAAALSVTHEGATPSIPSDADVLNFMNKSGAGQFL